jgi:hypothetical protein
MDIACLGFLIVIGLLFDMECIIGEEHVFFVHTEERCDAVNKYKILTYLSLS